MTENLLTQARTLIPSELTTPPRRRRPALICVRTLVSAPSLSQGYHAAVIQGFRYMLGECRNDGHAKLGRKKAHSDQPRRSRFEPVERRDRSDDVRIAEDNTRRHGRLSEKIVPGRKVRDESRVLRSREECR